jgi:hypothetical protein
MGVAEVEEEEDFEIVVGRLHCEETRWAGTATESDKVTCAITKQGRRPMV